MEQLEEFDKALKSYQKAVLLSPTNPVVYHNIGRYHLMQGNMNEASKYYRNELEHRLKRSTRKCVDNKLIKKKNGRLLHMHGVISILSIRYKQINVILCLVIQNKGIN